MISDARSRRLGALVVAAATALVAALTVGDGPQVQPIALPVVFGVALATAIDPRLWLVHLAVAAAGLVGADILPLAQGPGSVPALDGRLILSAMVPAFIGAAMVRLACRSAL